MIWGGVPSSILCDPFGEHELTDFVSNLLGQTAPGDGIVLDVGDSVMPEAKIDRASYIAKAVREHGRYPMPRAESPEGAGSCHPM